MLEKCDLNFSEYCCFSSPILPVQIYVSVPSEPLNFVNKSRTSTTVDFSWLPPLHHNGRLVSYHVMACFLVVYF